MRRVRWSCPNGCASILASTRPRSDDVARFCLPCSAKAGRLVRRAAPALEKERSDRCQRQDERSKQKAARDRAEELARWTYRGVDMREALRIAWGLPASLEWRTRRFHRPTPPSLHLRVSKEHIRGRLGAAWYGRHHVQVRVIRGDESVDPFDTLLHEVAHILLGKRPDPHGPVFRALLARLHEQWDAVADARGLPKLGGPEKRWAPKVPEVAGVAADPVIVDDPLTATEEALPSQRGGEEPSGGSEP